MLHLLLDQSAPDWTWLTSAGSTGILAAVAIAFWKGWIVSGVVYSQQRADADAERVRREEETRILREERDRAMAQIYAQAEIATRALEALEKKTAT